MQNANERNVMACPYNGKKCTKGKREDFPLDEVGEKITCRLWTHVIGMDPQTGQQIDNFDCSHAWAPTLMIENSNQVRQATASIDKTANIIYGSLPPMIQEKVKNSVPALINVREVKKLSNNSDTPQN